jgi:hypothetical protein
MTAELESVNRPRPPDIAEWDKARPDVIPRPTFFPAAMAFGTTFLLWGLITSPVVLAMGSLLIVVSLVGWIGEMRHER